MRAGGSAGQRTRYVLIEQCVDPEAQFPSWEPLEWVWMARQDMSAYERYKSDQEVAYADTRWVLPYRPDMDPELIDVPAVRRLSYQGRLYDIRDASQLDKLNREIELTTLARVG